MSLRNKLRSGSTILEISLVVALVVILATILLMVIDPVGMAGDARNRKRETDAQILVNLVYRNISDNGGTFTCSAGALPTSTTNMSDNSPAVGDYDIAGCLVPKYTSSLPYDPNGSGSHYASVIDYDLQYSIMISSTTNRVTVSAQNAERGATVSVTR